MAFNCYFFTYASYGEKSNVAFNLKNFSIADDYKSTCNFRNSIPSALIHYLYSILSTPHSSQRLPCRCSIYLTTLYDLWKSTRGSSVHLELPVTYFTHEGHSTLADTNATVGGKRLVSCFSEQAPIGANYSATNVLHMSVSRENLGKVERSTRAHASGEVRWQKESVLIRADCACVLCTDLHNYFLLRQNQNKAQKIFYFGMIS